MKRSAFISLIMAAIALLTLIVAAGCSGNAAESDSAQTEFYAHDAESAPAQAESTALAGFAARGPADDGLTLLTQAQGGTIDRIILRSATLRAVIDDPAAGMQTIVAMSDEFGGWVVSSSTSQYRDDEVSASITVRVPAERFDDALDRIRSGVNRIDSESVSGQDVTQEYTDLNSQLENLLAAEEQLALIMDEARTTEAVLSVYNELVRVRGEIEVIQGRIRYYEESAAYSSISVTLIPPTVAPELEDWSPVATAENAFEALLELLQGLVDLAIVVAVVGLPIALLVMIPIVLIVRALRRKSTPAAPPLPSEA